jgi:hypothetical protein
MIIGISIADLSPSGDSGPDQMAMFVEGDLFPEGSNEWDLFGTRADQTHTPSKNIDQLRDLV